MNKLTAAWILGLATLASADTIRLKNGGALEGVVLKDSEGSVVIRLKYATVTVERTDIESIEKKAEEPAAAAKPLRLARWEKCVEVVAGRPWAGALRQIPATVVDKGVLKNVPYMSHKSGNYEFNLYGDPDEPACLEIGVYKDLLKSDEAKRECLAVMSALLGDAKDVEALKSLHLAPGKKDREGLTFEVTPETAEDAYDGWWITVYDPKLLDEARASEEELKKITVSEEDLAKEEAAEKDRLKKDAASKADDKKKTDPKAPSNKSEPQATIGFNPYLYQQHELHHARISPQHRAGSVRRFYVRGYHRPKGGAYTRPGIHR
jgi:hypothetical protein